MSASKCFAPLAMGNQLQVLAVGILREMLAALNPMADTSPQSLMASASCFSVLSPGELAIIQTQLLCEILNSGGGGGGAACILSGPVDPVAAPPFCSAALYVNLVTSSFWYWDNGALAWYPLIV